MAEASGPSGETTRLVEASLARLEAGDRAAIDELIAIAFERMRGFAHRMLRTFPGVRRWDQTDDVMQNAAMRLHRALAEVTPQDSRGFFGLAAVQIRRELLDLARKHSGPESYAANHDTNAIRVEGEEKQRVLDAPDLSDSVDHLSKWTRLHDVAGSLPEEEREVFHLAWYMGLKQQEIADIIGCSSRTVKRRWESVRTLMARAMRDCPLD